MDVSLNDIITELEDLLGGLNYVVWVDLIQLPAMTPGRIEASIRAALDSNGRVGRVEDIGVPEMLKTIEDCLRYSGDRGHGPDRANLKSPRFNELIHELLKRIGLMASRATRVVRWSFQGANPSAAIFWEFNFAWIDPDGTTVLTGGSSD